MTDHMNTSGNSSPPDLSTVRRRRVAGDWIRLSTVGVALSLGLLFGGASTAGAHHTYSASYDLSRPVQIQGVIQELRYANPHVEFIIGVQGADGSVVPWSLRTRG